jgi:hypothetical protein
MTVIAAPLRAPLRLTIHGRTIDCPRAGGRPAADCDACRYLQGTLLGSDPVVLCGYLEPRLAIVRPVSIGPSCLEQTRYEQARTSAAHSTANCASAQASAAPTTPARTGDAAEATDDAVIFYTDWPLD